ncbi:hypothetical protein KSP39_PZI018742 [Platanthera zijinensis]|uniref:25S rRNA (uridine-N(3))-methyltransferase BMT5-like domain-containing protein n=1 Tax=Platanthera zijinensis TaxID=2320716 RepID=A0AAP0B3C3_9ASPA
MYKKAENNVIELEQRGAIIIHEVDATKLQFLAGLHENKFDRIIYNFTIVASRVQKIALA